MVKEKVAEERKNGVVTYMGQEECPHCRQLVQIETTDNTSQEERAWLAEESCNCTGAQVSRGYREREERIEARVEALFGDKGVRPVGDKLRDYITSICKMIIGYQITKATITLSKPEKVSITTDSKGKLKINYELKKNKEETV